MNAKDIFEKVQQRCYAAEGFSKEVQKLKMKVSNLEETLETIVDDSSRLKTLCQIEAPRNSLLSLKLTSEMIMLICFFPMPRYSLVVLICWCMHVHVNNVQTNKVFVFMQDKLEIIEEAIGRAQGHA